MFIGDGVVGGLPAPKSPIPAAPIGTLLGSVAKLIQGDPTLGTPSFPRRWLAAHPTQENVMATTVGTESDMSKLIEDFAYLERDAVAAYDEAISRLDSPERKAKVAEFREDHVRHLSELEGLAAKHGATFPLDGDMKEMLTTGKIKMADVMGGDGAILKAMSTNETDTVTAYSKGSSNAVVPAEDRAIFERAHQDEERHKAWMDAEAQAA